MRSRMRVGVLPFRGLAAVVAMALLIGLQPAAAFAAGQPGASPAIHDGTSAPVDTSGIEFSAFRSFGMPIVPGESFTLQVRRTVATGPMQFQEVIGGSPETLGAATWQNGGTVNGVDILEATWTIENPTAGTHTYRAAFEGTDEWDAFTLELAVDVEPVETTVTIEASENPVQANREVMLHATVSSEGTGAEITGTIEWRNADTNGLIGTTAVGEPLVIPSLSAGTYRYTATYSGDETHAASTSPVFTLTVSADSVDASGVKLEYGTFYPVKDGYRDTVAIMGSRSEPISVSIKVYNPDGKLVRSAAVAVGTGKYAYRWNGRNSAGTILAAGSYKVVQKLTDGQGTTKAFTAFVKLSKKKLVTHTTSVTKRGTALAAAGGAGTAKLLDMGGGVARFKAGNGFVGGGWEFRVPSAVVYSSVQFKIYAKARYSAPSNAFGLQNFTTCPRTSGPWDDTCFSRWKAIGNATGSLKWYASSKAPASGYLSGRYVRGLLEVINGTVDVYKVRVSVVYKTLE